MGKKQGKGTMGELYANEEFNRFSKLSKDIKRNGVGVERVGIKSKVTRGFKSFCRDILALWRLIVTVSEAMGAYILIPQSALGDKVIGGVLLISAVTMAVKQYTNHD